MMELKATLPTEHLDLRLCFRTLNTSTFGGEVVVVNQLASGIWDPIYGCRDHIVVPAQPAIHLRASEPPAAKAKDLPRGWARDSTRWV